MDDIPSRKQSDNERRRLMRYALQYLDDALEIFLLLEEYGGSVDYFVISELIYLAYKKAEQNLYLNRDVRGMECSD